MYHMYIIYFHAYYTFTYIYGTHIYIYMGTHMTSHIYIYIINIIPQLSIKNISIYKYYNYNIQGTCTTHTTCMYGHGTHVCEASSCI